MSKAELDQNMIATVAGEITVYNYDGETHEYLSSSVEYLPAGVGIPANSCIDAPHTIKEGFTVCRTADGNHWKDVVDHRGETLYSTTTGEKVAITRLGDYPEDTTKQSPATPYDKWNGDEWETDTNAQHSADVTAADQQKAALMAEATAIITPLADAQAGGYIDDVDVPRLAEWQRYRYNLTKVDTSTAPAITLPPKPEV
ncbi:tail fiber assembly protein [Enterobacter asburiae]|nr:tail fiber assembly protein [Escherichia coli]